MMNELLEAGRRARDHVDLLNKLRARRYRFKEYTRLTVQEFDELLSLLTPIIEEEKYKTAYPHINAKERLLTTLIYLGTGCSYVALQYFLFRGIISCVVMETCAAIILALKNIIALPETEAQWEEVANKFQSKWDFPNCLGAVDGTHINIRKPDNEMGYLNYHGNHSIVLIAVADADSKLMMVSIGTKGSVGDNTVFEKTDMNIKLEKGELKIPQPRNVDSTTLPFVFIGDSGFANREQLLSNYISLHDNKFLPNVKLQFNSKLGVARHVVENVFANMKKKI